jgi:hypothetical protein
MGLFLDVFGCFDRDKNEKHWIKVQKNIVSKFKAINVQSWNPMMPACEGAIQHKGQKHPERSQAVVRFLFPCLPNHSLLVLGISECMCV